MSGWVWPLALFLATCAALIAGFPVAFTLAGMALVFAGLGSLAGVFESSMLGAFPNRLYGIMTNETLIAVPLFIYMGALLQQSRIAEDLLAGLAGAFRRYNGGLGLAVLLVGALMAASTGIVGATVVTMGLIALPGMLRQGYAPTLASGTICAAGTLGQIIPPSIVLVLLGDVVGNAWQQAQLRQGVFSPQPVSVGDLFAGALLPGIALVGLYMVWMLIACRKQRPATSGPDPSSAGGLALGLLGPLALILVVLGTILAGLATPTEAAALGTLGAFCLAAGRRRMNRQTLGETGRQTVAMTAMVFMILVGASLFTLVFRGLGGDAAVHSALATLPGGVFTAVAVVMVVLFLLGFVLDFIEIIFVVVPIVGPVLLAMGIDPIWLGVMIAINLQTSFLTPPFGFALFYLRGTAPESMATGDIYRGAVPFILIQLLMLGILAVWPELATWLPGLLRNA